MNKLEKENEGLRLLLERLKAQMVEALEVIEELKKQASHD